MKLVRAMHERVERYKALHPRVTFWIGAFKSGGHGDYLTLCAFARAARRHWAQKLGTQAPTGAVRTNFGSGVAAVPAGETIGVMVIGRDTGMPADYDITYEQPGIDVHMRMPEFGWKYQAAHLAPHFDAFYEVQYAVRAVIRDKERFAVDVAEARDRLDYWRGIYDFFPHSSQYIDSRVGMNQWQLMSETAGFPVEPSDLFISTETPDIDGHGTSTLPSAAALGACVTIHNSEGGTGITKCLPRDVPKLISETLVGLGVAVAHVGTRDRKDALAPGAMDMRGLRLTETAAVIARARLHVDIEGGLVYVAKAVGTPSVVFFGPTPPSVFGFGGNVNYTRAICPFADRTRHCWWSTPNWARACPLGFKNCVNLPQAETAVRVVLDSLAKQGNGRHVQTRVTRGGAK